MKQSILNQPLSTVIALCCFSVALTACGGGGDNESTPTATATSTPMTTSNPISGPTSPPLAEDDLFAKNSVVNYDINLVEEEWDILRHEGRSLLGACPLFPGYTFFNGRVTVDGVAIDDVEIRKKGSIGSLSSVRPSIKLDFGDGELNEGRTYRGHRRVTLNNNKQDASNIEQCLGYEVFRRAGVHAPLCNLATVSYQGEMLGVYTHVENIKKPFLMRSFGNDSGNLYEGRGSDFNPGRIFTFEKKTNEMENDRSDLQAVITALNVSNNELLDSLDNVIDMDEFISFIAVEALIGHTDSYSGFQNNFFIYNDPTDEKFHFIPWGADQAFQQNHLTFGTTSPQSIHLYSSLTERLWQIEAFRSRYDARMNELLNTVWDEDVLITEATRLASLVTSSESTDSTISFIQQRRAIITAELGTDRVREGTGTPRTNRAIEQCAPLDIFSDINVTFSTTITDQGITSITGVITDVETFDLDAQFSIEFEQNGQLVSLTSQPGTGTSGMRVRMAERNFFSIFPTPEIQLFIDNNGVTENIVFYLPSPNFATGTYPFHGFDTVGIAWGGSFIFRFITEGEINLQMESSTPGSAISGTINAHY